MVKRTYIILNILLLAGIVGSSVNNLCAQQNKSTISGAYVTSTITEDGIKQKIEAEIIIGKNEASWGGYIKFGKNRTENLHGLIFYEILFNKKLPVLLDAKGEVKMGFVENNILYFKKSPEEKKFTLVLKRNIKKQ